MSISAPSAKDPAIGMGLSVLFPGLGHLYAGRPASFAVFLAVELFLFARSDVVPLLVLHLFQAIAAGGAVKTWNRQHAAAAAVVAIPAPPPATRAAPVRPQSPVRPAEPPPKPAPMAALDADAFLAELQSAWRDHRSGDMTAREFADRKWRAVHAVVTEDEDDAEAIVAAAHELVSAGVLTSEDVRLLETRLAR